ncbi:hypothetical protein E2320_004637 [Naja naja]|nr:hypothetical protein E2320_004637 [Naja naja]
MGCSCELSNPEAERERTICLKSLQIELSLELSLTSGEMMAPLNFPPFRLTTKTWTSYINRCECVMDAANLSDIPSNRKKAYFLSFCGATVFDTATTLLAPQLVKAVTWEDLQEVLGNHYAPKPSRIAHRHAFRRRSQAEGESIGEYMAAL